MGLFSTKTKAGRISPTMRAISNQSPDRFSGDTATFAARADILARKSSADGEIISDFLQEFDVFPAFRVFKSECCNIVPDWEHRATEIPLPLQ